MPKKANAQDEHAVKPPARRMRKTAVTGRPASTSSSVKPAKPDTQEDKAVAEQKQPKQVVSVKEAFKLTLEQYDEVFKRLA